MDRQETNEKIELQEKLKKYEKRLRDLVAAYKSLQNEKEALDKMVQVLSSKSTLKTQTNKDQGSVQSDAEDQTSVTDSNHYEKITSELEAKVSTLSETISTLNTEKKKMETNFQADRKVIIKDYEDKMHNLKQELDSCVIIRKELNNTVADLKVKLRDKSSECDQLEAERGLMLHELQTLLAQERDSKEKLESQLEECQQKFESTKKELVASQSQIATQASEISRDQKLIERNKYLENELAKISESLKFKESELDRHRGVASMTKVELQAELDKERRKAEELQNRLNSAISQHEKRIADLEANLGELSKTLGACERERAVDQDTIQKLRERIVALDFENSSLSKLSHGNSAEVHEKSGLDTDRLEISDNDDSEAMQLVSKILNLKDQLLKLNDKSKNPVDITKLMERSLLSNSSIHKKCEEKYDLLKDEFEKYKLKAQSVLKSKSNSKPDASSIREIDQLQHQIVILKQRIRDQEDEAMAAETSYKRTQESLKKSLQDSTAQHQAQLVTCHRENEARVSELQNEFQRHRNRTIALLSEKDEEINLLRSALQASKSGINPNTWIAAVEHCQTGNLSKMNSSFCLPNDSGAAAASASVFPELPVNEEWNQSVDSLVSASKRSDGCSLVHCVDQKARKDLEIRGLRSQKRKLEHTLRQLQNNQAESETNWSLRETELQDQIRVIQQQLRQRSPSGSSSAVAASSNSQPPTEYLKNVFLRYLVTSDATCRSSMLRAMVTVLQFTDAEQQQVKLYHQL